MSESSLCLNAVIEGMLLTKSDSEKTQLCRTEFSHSYKLDQSFSI